MRVALVLGHATFIALLALAWEHARVRTAFGDTAYQVFKWVNDHGIAVEAHRYSAILPQLAVKLLKLFHVGLPALLYTASLAHVLVAYGIFLLCLYAFKAPRTAMAMALAAVLCTRLTFYGPVLEANYLLSYPFLAWALLEGNDGRPLGLLRILLLWALAMPTLLVHPLGWGVLVFGLFFLMAVGQVQAKDAWVASAAFVMTFLFLRLLFPPTVYEQGQYVQLQGALGAPMGPWASWDFLVGHTFMYTFNYLPALVVCLAVFTGYAFAVRWKAVLVGGGGMIVFLAVMLVAYRHGDDAVMMDRAFLPAGTLLALPASYLFRDLRGRKAWWALAALTLVLFVKLRDVSFASRGFSRQMAGLEQLMDAMREHGLDRVQMTRRDLQEHGVVPGWALPFSSLMISSWNGPDRSVAIRLLPDENAGDTLPTSSAATPTLDLGQRTMDGRYFHIGGGPWATWPASQ
ncbi:MAG TPA: hypothetical protein PKD45_08310 [Flavobacteriales bacterium]|nr:hypothetical protein [Flavobacteriales bacterium]